MKKWTVLVLMLVMATLLLAGCNQQTPEKTAALIIADVDGEKITRGEAYTIYNFLLNQFALYNAQYGYTVDTSDSSVVAEYKNTTLNMMIEGLALKHKMEELVGPFTEEELAQFKVDGQAEYDKVISDQMESTGADEALAKATIDSYGFTPEALTYMIMRDSIDEKLYTYASDGVTVSDEEVAQEYESLLAQAKETYDASPSQYVTDVLNGNAIYTRPEGFRSVQNLVIPLPDEISEQVSEKNNEYYAIYQEEYNDRAAQSDESLSDEERAEIEARLETYEERYAKIEEEIEALQAQGREAVRESAEQVLALAKEPGADFYALMQEHSSDTASETLMQEGYPVASGITNYVDSFTQAALLMGEVGEISDLVESSYGYHILKYTSDLQAGPVPYEDVETQVRDQLLETKKDEVYQAKLTEWIGAAKIKAYADRF